MFIGNSVVLPYSCSVSELQKIEFDPRLIARYGCKVSLYASYPTIDRFNDKFTAQDYQHILCQRAPGTIAKPLAIYIHLPFCTESCYYCVCDRVITKDHTQAVTYLDYLIREINLQADQIPHRAKVVQLHLGGGTPTFLSDAQLRQLMEALQRRFDLLPGGEFSIEIDPRTVQFSTLALLLELGFNAICVTVQDGDPQVQQAVNRIQSEEETRRVIEEARKCGFSSIRFDLIYGLPKQTVSTVQTTLQHALQMCPDRFALHNYTHMPERFMQHRYIHQEELPSPEVNLEILGNSTKQLTDAGFVFIGMDHFSLPGDELAKAQRRGQLHWNFQGYSTYAECDAMAFGVSAISKVGATYCQNTKRLPDYYAIIDSGQLPVDRGVRLSRDDLLRRSIIQSLVCQFELSFQPLEIGYLIDFKQYFEKELADLALLAADGLLVIEDEQIRVLPSGRPLAQAIAMIFDRYLRTHARAGDSGII